jgi:hypothetical protein
MIPWWCESYRDYWEMTVDRWFTEVYIQEHEAHQEHALQVTGPTHHQGSRSLTAYKQEWVREFIFSILTLDSACFF